MISSPRLNTEKVNRIIREAGKRQELGVKVTIVTWHPDAYKYGRAEVRMELMEKLRKAGFEVKLVEESCEHFESRFRSETCGRKLRAFCGNR